MCDWTDFKIENSGRWGGSSLIILPTLHPTVQLRSTYSSQQLQWGKLENVPFLMWCYEMCVHCGSYSPGWQRFWHTGHTWQKLHICEEDIKQWTQGSRNTSRNVNVCSMLYTCYIHKICLLDCETHVTDQSVGQEKGHIYIHEIYKDTYKLVLIFW